MTVEFTVSAETKTPPNEIINNIFDISQWDTFEGWGPIPKIASVEMSGYTPAKVGTVFSVKNADGSSHKETVIDFTPDKAIVMRMDSFTLPLSKVASHIIESWQFEVRNERTYIQRSFTMHPKSVFGDVMLRPIARFLQKAIEVHTAQIAGS